MMFIEKLPCVLTEYRESKKPLFDEGLVAMSGKHRAQEPERRYIPIPEAAQQAKMLTITLTGCCLDALPNRRFTLNPADDLTTQSAPGLLARGLPEVQVGTPKIRTIPLDTTSVEC